MTEPQMVARIKELEQKCENLRKALSFYADERNYEATLIQTHADNGQQYACIRRKVVVDTGDIARAALNS